MVTWYFTSHVFTAVTAAPIIVALGSVATYRGEMTKVCTGGVLQPLAEVVSDKENEVK